MAATSIATVPDEGEDATAATVPRPRDADVVPLPTRGRHDRPIRLATESRPRVDITNEVDAFERLSALLGGDSIPLLYQRSGGLCRIETETIGADTRPVVRVLTAENLRAYFGQHVYTYKPRQAKDGRDVDTAAMVMRGTCATILGRADWPNVPALRGIVTAPILRPDGTMLQAPGFDAATGLYHYNHLGVSDIPERPTADAVTWARTVVRQVFGDFPFVARSDRAQYLASLFSVILRPYVPGPTPLFIITASSPGTGKSLLKDVHKYLFNAGALAWSGDESELRKAVTAKLLEGGEPVIGIDNLPSGGVIRSPILAALLTLDQWGDRVLGSSTTTTVPNDRTWVVTGNNLRTGGDLARRSIWCRLDTDVPDPDRRAVSEFALGDLRPWLTRNAGDLLTALLVLVADWAAAGAPRADVRMADYSAWASVMGGLLDHIGYPGWLEDRDATTVAMDEEVAEWTGLLAEWERVYPDGQSRAAREILAQGLLNDVIPRTARGELPAARQLGQWFTARRGRYFGALRLVSTMDAHTKSQLWKVERYAGSRGGAESGAAAQGAIG
jgi:hypothetical protein